MNSKIEELLIQRTELKEKLNLIDKQIDELQYDKKINSLQELVGNCYKELDTDGYNFFIYVYGVDIDMHRLNSIEIVYNNEYKNSFRISFENYYDIDDFTNTEYEQITKEEFDKHFEIVINEINNRMKL